MEKIEITPHVEISDISTSVMHRNLKFLHMPIFLHRYIGGIGDESSKVISVSDSSLKVLPREIDRFVRG